MFSSLDEQLERVRRWNHTRRWGFTKNDFDAVDVTDVEHRHALIRDVVAVYLPGSNRMDGVRRTRHELWSLVARDHPTAYAWDDGEPWTKPVRLLDGIQHRPGGLSWFRPENRVSLTALWADLSPTFWAAPVVVGRVSR